MVMNRMETRNPHAALWEMNQRWLGQALELLGRIDHARFSTSPAGFAPHRVSGHLRHIVEFYECFLDGMESLQINYDARRRDPSIEVSQPAAADRIRSIMARLHPASGPRSEGIVLARIEDADGLGIADPFVISSVGRELMMLSSHTIHHFALTAMTLRAHGFDVDPDFGVAPSTLRFQASQRPKATAA